MMTFRCPHCGTMSNALVHCVLREDGTRIPVERLFKRYTEVDAPRGDLDDKDEELER